MFEVDNIMYFTISNIDVSLANAIRRTILSDIQIVAIKTFPYDKNDATFHINTSRFNNEILKQRLSCIPIYISDLTIDLADYLVELDVNNTSGNIIYVTTQDFKIKNIKTNKYLSNDILIKIFPPNSISNNYIEFCRLRPAYSEDSQGEHIKLSAKLSINSAKENGSFNCVSTCSYGNTPDKYAIAQAKQTKLLELQAKYSNDLDIEFHLIDWINLDAKRIFIPDSFDFRIKSIGIYTNKEIIIKSIKIILEKLLHIKNIYSGINNLIHPRENTIENCFEITLVDEDFTIGKIIEYSLYQLYYINDKAITFCGFNKPHPHINTSIIRLAFPTAVEKSVVVSYLNNSIDFIITYYKKLLPHFGELNPDEAIAIQKSIPSVSQITTNPPVLSAEPSASQITTNPPVFSAEPSAKQSKKSISKLSTKPQ
jgi:DNA-directed RNA polymerase subunit L